MSSVWFSFGGSAHFINFVRNFAHAASLCGSDKLFFSLASLFPPYTMDASYLSMGPVV